MPRGWSLASLADAAAARVNTINEAAAARISAVSEGAAALRLAAQRAVSVPRERPKAAEPAEEPPPPPIRTEALSDTAAGEPPSLSQLYRSGGAAGVGPYSEPKSPPPIPQPAGEAVPSAAAPSRIEALREMRRVAAEREASLRAQIEARQRAAAGSR